MSNSKNVMLDILKLKQDLKYKKLQQRAKIQLFISSVEKAYIKDLFEIDESDTLFDNAVDTKQAINDLDDDCEPGYIGVKESKESMTNSSSSKPPYRLVEFCDLKSGDFWIVYNGKLLWLFERKTLADLSASLTDERWKTQELKMSMMPIHPSRTFYWIEDSQTLAGELGRHLKGRANILGAILNVIHKHKRCVFRTQDPEETCLFMLGWLKKAFEFGDEYEQELKLYPQVTNSFDPMATPFFHSKSTINSSSSSSIDVNDDVNVNIEAEIEKKIVNNSKKRQGIRNSQTWYLSNLKAIKLMGEKAFSIKNRFPTQRELYKFLNDDSMTRAQKVKTIASLPVETSDMMKKQRRINKGGDEKKERKKTVGPALANKVYDYCMGIDDDDNNNDDDSVTDQDLNNDFNFDEESDKKPSKKKKSPAKRKAPVKRAPSLTTPTKTQANKSISASASTTTKKRKVGE